MYSRSYRHALQCFSRVYGGHTPYHVNIAEYDRFSGKLLRIVRSVKAGYLASFGLLPTTYLYRPSASRVIRSAGAAATKYPLSSHYAYVIFKSKRNPSRT